MDTMEEYSLKKKEIEEQLEEEKASIAWITESLHKSDQLSTNMARVSRPPDCSDARFAFELLVFESNFTNKLGILTSFEERLCKLEDAILPVHRETTDLQTQQDNIEKTLTLLDEVLSYQSVSANVKPVIESGPSGNLEVYLEAMVKMEEAEEFFIKNNPDSMELTVLNSLSETAQENLEKELQMLLRRNSRVVSLQDVQSLLNNPSQDDANVSTEESELFKITHFTDYIMEQICTISNWLSEHREGTDFMSVYAQIRSSILWQSILRVKSEPEFFTIEENGPKRKPGFDMRKRLSKKATKQVIDIYKSEAPTEEDEERQNATFLLSTNTMFKLMKSEWELLELVIPEERQIPIFSKLVDDTFTKYYHDAEQVCATAKNIQSRLDHSALQCVLPMLKYLQENKPKFDHILKLVNVDTRKKFTNVYTLFKQTGESLLNEFVERLKEADKHMTVSKDGTVHQVTTNVMIYLEELVRYIDTVSFILENQNSKEEPSSVVSNFISKVLTTLSRNLTNKSKLYDSTSLQAIFMLNNYNYILKGLNNTGILNLLQEYGHPNLKVKYEEVIEEEMSNYERSWLRVKQHLETEASDKLSAATGKGHLKEKYKQAIKDKFRGFNTDLEELHQSHKQFSVPDVSLKKTLETRICNQILPNYEEFLKRYRDVHFTKNVEKYVKYDVEAVTSLISRTFT